MAEPYYTVTTRSYAYFQGFSKGGHPLMEEGRQQARKLSLTEAAAVCEKLHSEMIDAMIEPVWSDAETTAMKFILERRHGGEAAQKPEKFRILDLDAVEKSLRK